MKKFFLFLTIAIFTGCQSSETKESVEKAISEHRKQIQEHTAQIKTLEQKLMELDTTKSNAFSIPVFSQKMVPTKFSHYLQINGRVEADNNAAISPEMAGQVKTTHVKEGERVTQGTLLISLNTAVIRNNLRQVESQLELITTTFEKQKALWEENIGSEIEYLQAKTNKQSLESQRDMLLAQLEMSLIKAPYDGIVDNLSVKPGEMATPGMPVIQLVNLKKLKIKGDLSETYLSSINKGDKVSISFPAYPQCQKSVTISRLGQIIDKDSRTFVVEVDFPNQDEKIKPNMLALMKIKDYEQNQALIVPSIIIKQDMQGNYLYIIKDGKYAHKQYIETGRSYNNQTVVISGLKNGDQVITSGFNKVSDGVQITIKQPEEFSINS